MSTAADGSSPPPPQKVPSSPPFSGHKTPAPAFRSGTGAFKHSAKHSVAFESEKSGRAGFVVNTMGLSAVRWIRTTSSEARDWARMGVTIYNGYTLEAMDASEIPKVPIANPTPIAEGSGPVQQAMASHTQRIEEALENTRDAEYAHAMDIHERTPPGSSAPGRGAQNSPQENDSSSSSGGAGSSIFD